MDLCPPVPPHVSDRRAHGVPRLRTRRSGCTLVALGLALLAAGCADPEVEPVERPALSWSPDPPASGVVQYDLIEHHDVAESWAVRDQLDPTAFESRPYLGQGWALPSGRIDRGEDAPFGGMEWSDETEAIVHVLLREKGPWRLKARVEPLVEGGRERDVRVALNGEVLGKWQLPGGRRHAIDVVLPAEHQRVGLNELAFLFDGVTAMSDVVAETDDRRLLSARIGPIRLHTSDARLRKRRAWVSRLLPEGSVVRRFGSGREVIEQASGSLVRHHLRVPADAIFRSGVAYLRGMDAGVRQAVMRLTVTPAGGVARTLLEQEVDGSQGVQDFEVDLAAYAGQVVQLELGVETPGAVDPVVGAWFAPAIWGEDPVADAPDPRVDQLRESLAGAPVVMILIDACNGSYLGCRGGPEGVTPNIDRIAREGVLLEGAHAVASYTISSIGSMFTGHYAWDHGAWELNTPLSGELPSWPEQFRAAGYRTVGVTHSTNGSSRLGFERGFDDFREQIWSKTVEKRVTLGEEILPTLDTVLSEAGDEPLFLWLHLIEPHRPYDPPQPWMGTYSAGYEGEVDGSPAWAYKIKTREYQPTQEDLEHLRAIYTDNLKYIDDVVGRIRTRLEEAGLFDEAIVCVFSDHGEGFCEHESKMGPGLGHGQTAYEDMMSIPCVFRLPSSLGVAGVRQSGSVSGLDLLPTIGDLVGAPAIGDGHGVSLVPMLVDEAARRGEEFLGHSYNRFSNHFMASYALWSDDFKLVYTPGDSPELYDLDRDPNELSDLAGEHPVLARYLLQRMRTLSGFDLARGALPRGTGERVEIGTDDMEELRALGYVR